MAVKMLVDSQCWLLAELLDAAGAKVTASTDTSTAVTATLTKPDGVSTAFAAAALAYDAAKTMTRPDGTVATGCWKRSCTPAELNTVGPHVADVIAQGATIKRHLQFVVQVVAREQP